MSVQDFATATRTTTMLLDALLDRSNEPAWSHLDARYRRVIAAVARRQGLTESDADEVAQVTLVEFSKAYRAGQYDRSKGRLSSWILGMARNCILRSVRDSARYAHARDTVIAQLPHARSLQQHWEDERDRLLLDQAMGYLRDDTAFDERTLQAFELVAMRSVPVASVAQQCHMTHEQVYVAKSRVTRKLRLLVQELTSAFEEDL